MLYGGKRRGASAAVVSGNEHDIGVRLRDSSGHRADARFRDELHADLCARINLLEVVDQLRQIFD